MENNIAGNAVPEAEEERSLLAAYNVKLETYEGPFDLLLAMIDKKELDINTVSMASITQGFLDYIHSMGKYNMLLAGEFLLMAAYLLEMKSRMLLPQPPSIVEEENLMEVEQELLERLAEYKIYKGLAQSLKERKDVFQRVYTRYAPEDAVADQEIFLVDVTLKDLVMAFKRVWDMAESQEPTKEIVSESFSVKDKISDITDKIRNSPDGISFSSLFSRYIKVEIIVTFLAILELMKMKLIKIMQSGSFSEIQIYWGGAK
jgi:segregation and condensation protein A